MWYELGLKPMLEARYHCFWRPKDRIVNESANINVHEGCALFVRKKRFSVRKIKSFKISDLIMRDSNDIVTHVDRNMIHIPG